MKFIQHRVNTLQALCEVPRSCGAEIDIRYHRNDLVLHHDPFQHHETTPLLFEAFLQHWDKSGPLILNIKTEGIEERCIELVTEHGVKDWFFLDLSMPYFVRYAAKAEKLEIPGFSPANLAVRFSEAEPIEYAAMFSCQADWLWVDCFTKLPLTEGVIAQIRNLGFKICLVSPELQGHPVTEIKNFKNQLKDLGLEVEAVCTKTPAMWEHDSE